VPAAAAVPARECLELARRFDDPSSVVDALQVLGQSLVYCGAPDDGLSMLEEAVALAGLLGADHPALAWAALMLATAVLFGPVPERTSSLLAESRRICRLRGDRWWLGIVLNVSVVPALLLGAVDEAEAYGREGLQVRRGLIDPVGSGGALELLSWVAAAAGQYPRAACLLGAAERQWELIGGSPFGAGRWLTEHRAREAAVRQALGTAFDSEYGHGRELCLDEAVAYALDESPVPIRTGPHGPARLTRRENEIAELITRGMSNREIAAKLVISPRTVDSHVENILTKCGFTARVQIATWYAER